MKASSQLSKRYDTYTPKKVKGEQFLKLKNIKIIFNLTYSKHTKNMYIWLLMSKCSELPLLDQKIMEMSTLCRVSQPFNIQNKPSQWKQKILTNHDHYI